MDIDVLRNIWFFLIGILFTGYSILDGFDLGVGMLTPFIARDDREKKMLIDTVWPVWDGNEVWLVAGAGALFAAFPLAYATIFSGFYLLFMVILFALILRAVSMEFWYYDKERRRIWAGVFAAGSFLPPVLFGILAGNCILGVPLDYGLQFASSFSTIFRPYPVLTGLLVLVLMIVHGALYTVIKTEGALQERARLVAGRFFKVLFIVFIITAAAVFFFIPGSLSSPLLWIIIVLNLILLILLGGSSRNKKDVLSFIYSSAIFVLLWAGAGSLLYPDLLKGINDLSLNIYNASSSRATLQIMFIIAAVGMPIVIAYSIYVYRVFKGKVRE